MSRRARPSTSFLTPLSPERKWRAITFATLLLAPAAWFLLGGLVAAASDDADRPAAGPPIAIGLSLIPFVYVVLAFTSEHPRAPQAVVKAMVVCLLVGIPLSALAGDSVTGLVAGIGAGGILALRADTKHRTKPRVVAVAIAAAYTFLLARVAGGFVVVATPIFPFTALGLADHWSEWRLGKAAPAAADDGDDVGAAPSRPRPAARGSRR